MWVVGLKPDLQYLYSMPVPPCRSDFSPTGLVVFIWVVGLKPDLQEGNSP
jgi:hypothetical protein